MKLCDGCKFNLQNNLTGFEENIMKLLKRSCDRREFLSNKFIRWSCLELFALQLLKSQSYCEYESREEDINEELEKNPDSDGIIRNNKTPL